MCLNLESNNCMKNSIQRHIKCVHVKFKRHECEFCGKDFDRTLYLKNHIDRDHKGIKISGGKVNVLLL